MAMEERRVEKHLYERKRQTATGEWSKTFYVRLKDWKGKRRVWPAGNTLKAARAKKAEYEHCNAIKEDFDKDKVKGMTLAKWGEQYLTVYAKEKRSVADDARHIQHLCRILGPNTLLAQIGLAEVEEFKQGRKNEKYRSKPISATTIDRSLEVLRHMLRLAEQEEVIDRAPLGKLHKPKNKRKRVASPQEYQGLLEASSSHLQRILVCCYETGMRSGEIKGLTWEKVDWKEGFIRLKAEDTKERKPKNIPISPALRSVFLDVRRDQREGKVASITGHVFTWKDKPMTEGWKTAYKAACRRAGITDLRFHDLRHTFVTRKVKEGWDYKRIMAITGHSTFAVFQDYNNPSDEDIKEVVSGAAPHKKAS